MRLTAAAESFEEVRPDDPRAVGLYREMAREVDELRGVPVEVDPTAPSDLVPPGGALLLVTVDARPVAIAGIRDLDGEVAEIKAMYVVSGARRGGLARNLLGRLESIAAGRGCRAIRLDTAAALQAATRLYESGDYREIPAYNENPNADRWFERSLSAARRGPGGR